MTQIRLHSYPLDTFCDFFRNIGYNDDYITSGAEDLADNLGMDLKKVGTDAQSIIYVKDTLETYIGDICPEAISASLNFAAEHVERMCQPLAVDMLMQRGINPIALLHIEMIIRTQKQYENTVYDAQGMRNFLCILKDFAKRGREEDYASVQIAEYVWWDGRILYVPIEALPQSIQSALIGKSIHNVVKHPFIDSNLRIKTVKEDGPKVVGIETEGVQKTCSWRDAMSRYL